MELAAKLDDFGKPGWILATILGFLVFWPIGLGLLIYMIWSGRMGFFRCGGPGRWHNERQGRHGRNARGWSQSWRGSDSSGNAAFDEYREDTLRRLEEEQKEFREFLERLRHAKDKAEFDAFMAERRNGGSRDERGSAGPAGEGPIPQPQG